MSDATKPPRRARAMLRDVCIGTVEYADDEGIIRIPIGKYAGKTLAEVTTIDEVYGNVLAKHFFWADTDEKRIAAVQMAEAELRTLS